MHFHVGQAERTAEFCGFVAMELQQVEIDLTQHLLNEFHRGIDKHSHPDKPIADLSCYLGRHRRINLTGTLIRKIQADRVYPCGSQQPGIRCCRDTADLDESVRASFHCPTSGTWKAA